MGPEGRRGRRGRVGPRLPWRRLLAVAGAAALAGCMPWVVGERAETLAPGSVRLDGGLATLSPPDQPQRVTPVPQVRLTAGLRDGVDAAVSYALPLTAHGRLRLRLHEGRGVAVAAAAGWGLHGIPDLAGADRVFLVPFATAELQLSARGPGPRWYGALRAFVPYHAGDPAAAVLWLAPQAGVELGTGRFRWGPELGVVVPTLHPGQTQLVLGVSARWLRE